MLETFRNMGCNMSFKINFLHSHLGFSPSSLGDISGEHDERFHPDIFTMDRCYQVKWSPSNACWLLLET
jgi:hypothetical protein